MPDCHVGEGGGVDCATQDFAAMGSQYNISFINAEVNAQRCTLRRAITEATDLQAWFNVDASTQSRLIARTASFCTERSGLFDGFDQGLSFFLPNQTWLQPPGYVHAMIASSLSQAPNALKVTLDQPTSQPPYSASAQISADGSTVVVQLVNGIDSATNTSGNVTISFAGGSFVPSGPVTVTMLATPEAVNGAPWETSSNTPAQPELVSPSTTGATWPAGSSTWTVALPPYSFTILQIKGATAKRA